MQLSASIVNVPTNSNGSRAASPTSMTTQHTVRAPASGYCSEPVPAIPARPALPLSVPHMEPCSTPSVTHHGPPEDPRMAGGRPPSADSADCLRSVCATLPVHAIGEELREKPFRAHVSPVVHTVAGGTDTVHVIQADSSASPPPTPFPRAYVTTSAPFLITVLARQTFLGVDDPNLAQAKPTVVISKLKLRALFMKALAWFIDRECVKASGAVIVFIGNSRGHTPDVHLALSLDVVRKLADEFGMGEDGQMFDQEFMEFEVRAFHGDNFYIKHGGWVVAVAAILAVVVFFSLVLLYAFLRDIATKLVFLS